MAWLYKRGNRYWIGWRHGTRQFLRPTGETLREEAEKQLEKVRLLETAKKADALTEDFYRAATGKQIKAMTADAFLTQWLKEAESTTTESTMCKYRQVVREFSEHLEAAATGIKIDEITSGQVQRFLAEKSARSSSGTVKGFRRILSSIFIRARDLGYLHGNPVALVRRASRHASEGRGKRAFTLAEVKDLHSRATPFWKYMIVGAFFTGQSLGDLATLKRENVDLQQNVVRLTRRKTGKRVIIPLAITLRKTLVRIWPDHEGDFFWPDQAQRYLDTGASSLSQEFYELMSAAGMVTPRKNKQAVKQGRGGARELSGIGFHNLRHTFITNLKIAGAVDSVAKELAGHSSSAVNTHYTHLPIETLADAVDQLPEFSK